jgi:hypothetical protein
MTRNLVTAAPDEMLSSIRDKLIGGPIQCIPIIRGGLLIGIVSEQDIHTYAGYLDRLCMLTTRAPHSPQNRSRAGISEPYSGQRSASAAPQSAQNFLPGGVLAPASGQRIGSRMGAS